MKLSDYNIFVHDYPRPGEHLIFNTRTQALVKIDREFKRFLECLEQNGSLIPSPYKDNLEALCKMGIVVENEADDRQKLRDFLYQLKFGIDRSLFVVTILTTYDCNFNCTYCFEKNSRNKTHLDLPACDAILLWLKQRIEQLGYEGVYLNYYGGEPLLNPSAIEHISSRMKEWCEAKGMKFSFGLQTNGYLLTPELVDKYKKLGLAGARISVDGVKEDHDRYRPLRNGRGTFERIMENIQACVEKIKIDIATGYDKAEIEPVIRLIHYFEESGILRKLGRFLASPIHPSLGPKDNPAAVCRSECMDNFEDAKMAETTARINALLRDKGLPIGNRMAISICPLTRENGGVTIDPLGRIYRCNSLLGYPEFAVGDVRHEGFNEKQKEFRDLDVWRKCPPACPYLPMCNGGCRLMSFLVHKEFTVPSCKKAYLDKIAPTIIKGEYEEALAKRANQRYNNTSVSTATRQDTDKETASFAL